jgi:GNAT superfamily N-acetyltransferase
VTFTLLADRPEFRSTLAGWYGREWPDLFDENFTPFHELDSCLHRDQLNCTILALDGDTLLGAASLLTEDVLPLPECAPWLGTVVVDPALRGRGHGKKVVHAATKHARSLGIETLHLWTPHHRGFYEKLGWQFVRDYTDDLRSVAILRLHLFSNPA